MAAAARPAPATGFYAALALLLALATQACVLAVPLLTLHVFDGVLETRNLDTGAVLAVMFVVAILLAGLLQYCRDTLIAGLADALARRLERTAFEAGVRHQVPGDRAAGLGALRDAAVARRFLMGQSLSDASEVVFAPVAFALVFVLHPVLGWLTVAGAALTCLLALLASGRIDEATRRAADADAQARASLAASMADLDGAVGLGMQRAMLRHWRRRQAVAAEAVTGAASRAEAVRAFADLARTACLIALIALGALLVIRGELSWGGVFAAMMLGPMATEPLGHLARRLHDWTDALGAIGRLRRAHPAVAPAVPEATPPHGRPGLAISGLECRTPGGRLVVAGLTLTLEPGTLLLLAGPNGSGKSTLLRALLGIGRPSAGLAQLHGVDTARTARGELGPTLGYLPQGVRLLEGSVLENIGRFRAGPAAVVAAARAAGAHDVLGRLPLGYASPAGTTSGLSGGQRQVVGLARALLDDPAFIALDEPETGLDAAGVDALLRAVGHAQACGAVVVVATHQPILWTRHPHRLLRLAGDGRWSLVPQPGEDPS
jgi:ABC-type protease/lipase transport system fused ATPase/permease subunit